MINRSRYAIAPFELVRVRTLADACQAWRSSGNAAFMAGGIDLIDRLKGGTTIDRLIALDIADLRAVTPHTIGALATHQSIIDGPNKDLAAIWTTIASPRIRFTGTIGGNIMAGQPHYDATPALLALGAQARFIDRGGTAGETPLQLLPPDVLLTEVHLPTLGHLRADRSLHPIVSVYVGLEAETMRVAIGCVGEKPTVIAGARDMSAAMIAQSLPEPISNGLASASYRRRMVEVLTRRLLAA